MDDTDKLIKLATVVGKLREQLSELSAKTETVTKLEGPQGLKGDKGSDGKDGRDGRDGKDGKDGINGLDGQDGKDGVSVVNLDIAADGHLVVYLSDGSEIDAGLVSTAEASYVLSQSKTNLINAVDYLDFNLQQTGIAGAVGRFVWNDTDGTLDLGLKGGNVTLQLGQEIVQPVTNKTGTTLVDMEVVYVTGAQGNRMTVGRALADSDLTSAAILGVVTEHIADNQTGFVTTEGMVRNVDTSGFAEGAVLYLSPTVAGVITSTKPVAPQHTVMVGYCVRSHASVGSIYVKVQNGYELEELHNVLITSPTEGQTLKYDSTLTVWRNVSTPTITVSATAPSNPQTGDIWFDIS